MVNVDGVTSIPPGTVIGAYYEILEKLGTGGMATVYKAQHSELNRFAAIKVLHARFLADDEFVRRFMREARSTSALTHKNIISIFALGISDFGPYMALEYVEGLTLSQLLSDKGHLPVAMAVPIIQQVCAALTHAHAAGIIHRDLKPDNVMLLREPADGQFLAKVVDFGLAKAADSDEEKQRLTATGEVLGDPTYMSPEQVQGQLLDSRSDIYSLGCLMYECFTGEPPFKSDDPVATMIKRLQEPPQPFAQRRGVPRAYEEIVMAALAALPDERTQTAAEVGEHLSQALSGTYRSDLVVRRPTASFPVQKPQRSKSLGRWMIGGLIASLSVLAALTAFNKERDTKTGTTPVDVDTLIRQAETLLLGNSSDSNMLQAKETLLLAYDRARADGSKKLQARAAYDLFVVMRRKNLLDAISWLNVAVPLAEESGDLNLANKASAHRIIALVSLEMHEKAAKCLVDYEKKYEPKDLKLDRAFQPQVVLAYCQYRLKKNQEALDTLSKLDWVHTTPEWHDAACLLATIHLKSAHNQAAIQVISQVADAPDLTADRKAMVLCWAAPAFAREGDFVQAQKWVKAAESYQDARPSDLDHARLMVQLAQAKVSGDDRRLAAAYAEIFSFYESRLHPGLTNAELHYVHIGYKDVLDRLKQDTAELEAKVAKLASYKTIDSARISYIY